MSRLILILLAVVGLVACSEEGTSTPLPPAATQTPETIIQSDPSAGLAAQVNGDAIPLADLEEQITFFEAGSAYEAADYDTLVSFLLERLIDQKLAEQAAAQMGITITDEEIQTELTELETLATEQGISLEDFFNQQGIPFEKRNERIRISKIMEAVNNAVTTNLPTTGPRVRARHILVADEATARDILAQLGAGADFAQLASQYSLDPSSRDAGGDLGWISPGDLLQSEVENMVFALPPNTRAPDPVQSILGYHIIEVIERIEDQPLDSTRLAEQRQQAWLTWLDEQRAQATIVRYVGPNAQ